MRDKLSRFAYEMQARTAQFMAGRNGNDRLNLFIFGVWFVCFLLSIFFKKSGGTLFTVLSLALFVLAYFRLLSKNISKRRDENDRYLAAKYRFSSKLRLLRDRWVQRKEYKFFSCPSCHSVMRVPRGRGKIRIVCRRCGNSFMGRS